MSRFLTGFQLPGRAGRGGARPRAGRRAEDRPGRCRVAGRFTGAALAVVLVLYGLQAAGAGAAQAASVAGVKGAAPAPVSNAFALGGGVGGSVDQRTGAFQASLPLVNVAGRAGTGLSLSLSYDQSLAAQGVDRFGLGAGWSLGVPWVDTAGGVHVYPASGGSYAYDTGSPTGLYQYPLRDLSFAKDPGTIAARPGVAAQAYVYTLTLLDGTVDRFDAHGNLIEQADSFGNPIDLTWKQSGPRWQPTSVTDSYGQVTRFDYTTPGQIKVIAPVNAEGITATVTLQVDAGRLVQVTDALGQQTSFGYSPVTGLPDPLLASVVSPTGEHTGVTYTPLAYEPGVVVVNNITVTDSAGNDVLPRLHFSIDPPGNSNRHNYTGYPSHIKTGSDGLFTSGDFGYRYSTELSNGTSTVEATYNSLHLLTTQKVYATTPGQGNVLNQTQTYTYPPVTSAAHPPANYAKPTATTIVYGDPTYGPTRTVTTASSYDDRGLLTSATNAAGTTTATTYNAYGLPATQTVTGADGATSITTDTFTGDGKAVATATTAVGGTAASATARTVATYNYDTFGQVTGESLAWAKGAKPPGDSAGPDQIDDTSTISVDTAAHTATDVVTTAAGTPQAASTATVTDLVTGQVLSQTSPDKLTTSYRYDALGRTVAVTAPGGQTTTTAYPTPLITDTTAPSGLVTQTTTDVTGRTVKITDNVAGQKLVTNPAARTTETDHYSADGTQLTTTTPAGTTTTTFDALGRPTEITQPGGITQTDAYNDTANTQTLSVLPAGAQATDPVSVTKDNFDTLNQPTASATTYSDGTPQTPTAEAYDGLGRVSSYSTGNLTATPDYTGAGGLQTGTALTPTDPASFPGQPVTADTGNTLTGALTVKTLTEQSKTATGAGVANGAAYTYDAAGRVRTATDPAGKTTAYTYTPAGQIATITAPSGAVTTYTYNPGTGRLDRTDVRGTDGSTQDTGYTYYPATGLVKSVDDPEHPADAITYDYDPDGHVTAVHYPDGTTTAATYDDNGQLATTTDITGAVTTYTYNANSACGTNPGDLCQATQTRDGAQLASVAYTYDNLDRVHTITRASGPTTTLAYTDASQVKTETTTAADGTMLRADTYTYDAHGNTKTHTTTSALPAPAAPSQATARRLAASPPTTTTTAYGYDAYNRLIDSAIYPGATATGTPTTSTHYSVNVAGDVTGQTTTTAAGTITTVNTIDPGDRLTARTVNGVATQQTFDADGNVTRDLAGNTYTYNLTDQQDSVTSPAGVTTTYTYWPDRTRRAATTTGDGVSHTTTYHYATTGQIANDTYTGGGPAVTASYLLAVNREARTLLTSGSAAGVAQTTGAGTGYYLTDSHGSVTAMIDSQGQATAYDYGDYGAPIGGDPATAAHPAATPAGNAAVNPFTYDGAYTNPTTGTQYLPARTYDPSQGRFLSADNATEINRYQAFAANPITNTDPTGQLAIPQILTDAFAAALFIAFGVLSGGAAAPVLAGLVAGEEIAAGAIAVAALNAVSAATNIAAAGTSITLTANDAAELTGNGFLSDSQKEDLTTATTALGTIAGITGAAAGVVDSFKPIEAAASQAASTDAVPVASAAATEDENQVPYWDQIFGSDTGPAAGEDQVPYWDQIFGSDTAPASDAASAPTGLSNTNLGQVVAPAPLTPADQQFTDLQQLAGQDDFNPIQSPDADQPPLANDPPAVTPEILPTGASPSPGSNNVGAGTTIAESVTTAVQESLSSNTPGLPPAPASSPLGQNLQPTTIIPLTSGLSPDNPLGQ